MAILSPAIRSGPLLGALVALFLAVPATASDAQRHHYSIHGSLTPVAAAASSRGVLQLKSRLSGEQSSIPAQAGGDLVLTARLALSPLGCAGDTIFADGFDP